MGYFEKLLSERESVVLRVHRHIIFVILHMTPYILLTLALWGVAIVAGITLDGTPRTVVVLALLAASLYPLARAIYKLLFWLKEEYVITSRRIVQVEGLINKRTFDSALEKVNDVQMRQSLFGRVFGYGDIEIITGSDIGVNHLWGIANPFEFKRALLEAKIRLERPDDDTHTRERQADDGLDAARLLAALTDLRDSGVISAEEYEERRRQLLRRP